MILAAICVFLTGALIPRRPTGQISTTRTPYAWAAPRPKGRTRLDYVALPDATAKRMASFLQGKGPTAERGLKPYDRHAQFNEFGSPYLNPFPTANGLAPDEMRRRC